MNNPPSPVFSLRWSLGILLCFAQMCMAVPNVAFSPATNYPANAFTSVAVADFNNDGKPDLAVAGGHAAVSVLLGTGKGAFGPFTNYNWDTFHQTATGLAAADFNSDSNVDLVVIQGGTVTNVMVLRGDGTGRFTSLTNYTIPYCSKLVTGDFNGDGKTDLVLGRSTTNSITVLLGNGDGSFTLGNSYAPGAVDYLIADDVNGNGKLDLVAGRVGAGGTVEILVLGGNGDGSFGTIRTNVGPFGSAALAGLALADLNNDGQRDIAIREHKSGVAWIWLGLGDGTFLSATNLSAGFLAQAVNAGVAVGDVNGDGNLDLVVLNNGYPGPSYTVVWLGDGAGHFTGSGSFWVGANPYAVALTDLEGDGRLDIVTANSYNGGSLSVLLNRTAPVLSLEQGNEGQLTLTWPNWTGYQLQYAANPTALSWIPFTNPPSILSNRTVVSDSITNGARFFRLAQ